MSETTIEIPPVTRRVWWSKDLKNKWEKRITRVRALYNAAELTTVLVGMRRAYVYHIRSHQFDESYDMLRDNNMVYFPIRRRGLQQGFYHKHLPVKEGQPFELYGVAVKADDQEAGRLFVEYSKGPDKQQEMGEELLGYPACDTGFFDETWPEIQDPMFESALNTLGMVLSEDEKAVTVQAHPYCNQLLRYFGIKVTPHLCHSMQCEATIAWGEEWIQIMSQIDAEATKWLVELLSMPMTWDFYKGIAVIDTPVFRGWTNSNISVDRRVIKNEGWQ